jgi:hypothetical protein
MQVPGLHDWGSGDLKPNDHDMLVLGSDEFISRVGRAPTRTRALRGLQNLFDECAERFQLSRTLLVSGSKNRRLSVARAWLAREAVNSGIATVSGVARELQRSETAVRRLLIRHAQVEEDEHVRNVRPGTI